MDEEGYIYVLLIFLAFLFLTVVAILSSEQIDKCRRETIELIKINKATMQDLNSCGHF